MLRGRGTGSAESSPGGDRARHAKDRQPAGAARRGIGGGLVDWPGVGRNSHKTNELG